MGVGEFELLDGAEVETAELCSLNGCTLESEVDTVAPASLDEYTLYTTCS